MKPRCLLLINVVTGLGGRRELTKSPDIQKIAFTGSTQIGKLVAKNSLTRLKRLTLELGASRPTSSWTTPSHGDPDGHQRLLPE